MYVCCCCCYCCYYCYYVVIGTFIASVFHNSELCVCVCVCRRVWGGNTSKIKKRKKRNKKKGRIRVCGMVKCRRIIIKNQRVRTGVASCRYQLDIDINNNKKNPKACVFALFVCFIHNTVLLRCRQTIDFRKQSTRTSAFLR